MRITFICLYNSNYICNKTGLKRTKCSHIIRLLNIESVLEAMLLFSVMLLTFGNYDRKKKRKKIQFTRKKIFKYHAVSEQHNIQHPLLIQIVEQRYIIKSENPIIKTD